MLGDDGWPEIQAVLESSPTEYRAGRSYQQVWNTAPYGPSFPEPRWPEEGITRQANTIRIAVPIFSDAAGHAGGSLTETARTALYRNGKLVGESPQPGWGAFEVPAGRADYRLAVSATRTVAELATKVDVAWTFRSGEVAGGRVRQATGDGDPLRAEARRRPTRPRPGGSSTSR